MKKNHGGIVSVLLNISAHFVHEKKSSYDFCQRQGKEKYRLLRVLSCQEQSAASMVGAERNGSAPAAEPGCQHPAAAISFSAETKNGTGEHELRCKNFTLTD